MTAELERLYGGNLLFPEMQDRPYVIGNFVESLDGIVSFLIPGKSGGSPISGSSAEDHFVMAARTGMPPIRFSRKRAATCTTEACGATVITRDVMTSLACMLDLL